MTQRTSGITQDGEAALMDINEKGSANHTISTQRSIQIHEVEREKYRSFYVTIKFVDNVDSNYSLCTATNNL